jgi:nucleoside-diphosphate-sugar epimerase
MIAAEIRKHNPEFILDYNVDEVKQAIANSWPNSMEDKCAREEWGWNPKYDLSKMTVDMLEKVKIKFDKGLI